MSRGVAIAVAVGAAAAAAAALVATFAHKKRSKGPSKQQLDKLETVVLKNRDGVEVHITPVGASIQRFILPVGQQQEARDVVLGFNKASTYAVSGRHRRGQRFGGESSYGVRSAGAGSATVAVPYLNAWLACHAFLVLGLHDG